MHQFVHIREQGRRQDAGLVGGNEDGGHPEQGEDAEPDVGSGWLWVDVVHRWWLGIVSLEWGGYRVKPGMTSFGWILGRARHDEWAGV